MSERDVELVGRLLKVFQEGYERGDLGAGFDLGLMSEDLEFVPAPELPDPGVCRGRERFVEYLGAWVEEFDHWEMHPELLIDAGGGCVVGLLRQSATGHESGVPVELEFAQVYDLADGRVVRIRTFLDRDRALQAGGLRGRPSEPQRG